MTAERKPGEWVTGDAEDFLNDEGRPMERKTDETAWLAEAGTVGDVPCRVCGGTGAEFDADGVEDNCPNGCKARYVVPLSTPAAPQPETEAEAPKFRNVGNGRCLYCDDVGNLHRRVDQPDGHMVCYDCSRAYRIGWTAAKNGGR